ncbi:hypothetical protein [Streptomyces sp. NPDC001530]|uniref:hypothetical protein n=1 Tax=Streptomyces sp. NPDC001530 TaxID=3364582 RepID=UPI003673DF34
MTSTAQTLPVSARLPFAAAPALLGAYGVIRIVDGLDGSHGPGAAWTIGHMCFLVGLAYFVRTFQVMREIGGRDRVGAVGFWVGAAGYLALGAQFGIDLVVGFLSDDHADMAELFTRIQDVPGIEPVVYSFGPMLFFMAQLLLVTRLTARRVLRPWAPVLVLVATLLPFADKDLIPLGAVLLLVSFAPLYRAGSRRVALAA